MKLDKKLSKRDRTIIFLLRNRSDQSLYIQNFSDWGGYFGDILAQKSQNTLKKTMIFQIIVNSKNAD